MSSRAKARQHRAAAKIAAQRQAAARRRTRLVIGIAAALAVVVIGVLYAVYRGAAPAPAGEVAGTTPRSDYQVGKPGPGEKAPDFSLAAHTGGQLSLTNLRGKNVLLYFQEGLMCQPCWDQIKDLERESAKVKTAGIDQIVSITTDPVDLIARKMRDEGMSTPVLSDPGLTVSKAGNR